jgi:hypothetical protein
MMFDISCNFSFLQLFNIIASKAHTRTVTDKPETATKENLVSTGHTPQSFTSINDTNAGTAYEIASTGLT